MPALRCLALAPRVARGLSSYAVSAARERRLLSGVLEDALRQHSFKQEALQQQRERSGLSAEAMQTLHRDLPQEDTSEEEDKAIKKELRRQLILPKLLREAMEREEQLHAVRAQLADGELEQARQGLETLGLHQQLASYNLQKRSPPRGRPKGFQGLVLESPRGVPILVGSGGFSDEVMRRISSGPDLWFQALHGRGSRVMLRLTMLPAKSDSRSSRSWYASQPSKGCYKGPERRYGAEVVDCMQMAADVAAYFSEFRESGECVEVMYTDSRRVAARGARIGQLKPSKKLGVLQGMPQSVASVVEDAMEEQADLQ